MATQACNLVSGGSAGSSGGGNGTRDTAVYTIEEFKPQVSSSESRIESVVEGRVIFEGQPAITLSIERAVHNKGSLLI